MTTKELQELLMKRRNELGYSHQDVADKSGAGISRQYYGMIENGERRPSVATAKKISAFLKIDWTIFFEVESNEKLQKYEVG